MSNTGDLLTTLPLDKSELTFREKTMLDALYPPEASPSSSVTIEKTSPSSSSSQSSSSSPSIDRAKIEKTIEHLPKESKKVWGSFSDIIISTILFIILNLPIVDTTIANLYKTENVYYRIAMKSIIFAVTFFVLSNFSLARVN
jgi:hypothetical protein